MSSSLLLLAWLACSEEAPPPPPAPVAAPAPAPTPAAPAAPEKSPLEKARELNLQGKSAEALAEAEKLLPTQSADPAIWFLAAEAAKSAGDAGKLLDRLDRETAIGGQDLLHHRTRAELALAAGRAQDALDAAQRLGKADAELGAVYAARAVKAGATLDPATLDPAARPTDALVQAALGQKAKALPELKSWQGRLLAFELGLGPAPALEDPIAAAVAGPVVGHMSGDPAAFGAAAEAAVALGVPGIAADSLREATALWLAAAKGDQAFALASKVMGALPADGAPAAALAASRSALAEGELAKASEWSAIAAKASDPAISGEGAWQQAWAAFRASDGAALADAAGRAGNRKVFVDALAAVQAGRGDPASFAGALPPGPEGVAYALVGARVAFEHGADPMPAANRAVEAADALGWVGPRIEARLERERFARLSGAKDVDLGRELAAMQPGPALQAEVQRRLARRGAASSHSDAMTQARAQATGGQADAAYEAWRGALSAAPQWHRGPWALLEAEAPDLDTELKALAAVGTPPAALCALALHDWGHAAQAMDAAFAVGDDPSLSLAAEERVALNTAFARLRAQTLRWYAGTGEEPVAARKALSEAEAKARSTLGFDRALTLATADLRALREQLDGEAILSLRLGKRGAELVAITKDKGRILVLKDSAGLVATARRLLVSLAAGKNDAGAGDELRAKLLDPLFSDLAGVGRYTVLPDGPFHELSFATFPEQAGGLRYLGDIRTIGVALTAAEAYRPASEAAEKYSPEYLGVGLMKPEEALAPDGTRGSTEIDALARHFSEPLRQIFQGDAAKAEAVAAVVPGARFVHLAGFKDGDHGAIVFAEGQLELAAIRAMDLKNRVVILSAVSTSALNARRVQAFHAAGAEAVVTSSWSGTLESRNQELFRFFEVLIRDVPAARALAEAHAAAGESAAPQGEPQHWAWLVLHTRP